MSKEKIQNKVMSFKGFSKSSMSFHNDKAFTGQTFSKVENDYGYYYDDIKKERVFGVVGQRNIYEEIQSQKDATDMSFIKNHLLENGSDIIDESLFADVSSVAPDLLQNLCRMETAKQSFDCLPAKLRERYGNDIYRFAREYKQDDLAEFLPKTINNPQGDDKDEDKK